MYTWLEALNVTYGQCNYLIQCSILHRFFWTSLYDRSDIILQQHLPALSYFELSLLLECSKAYQSKDLVAVTSENIRNLVLANTCSTTKRTYPESCPQKQYAKNAVQYCPIVESSRLGHFFSSERWEPCSGNREPCSRAVLVGFLVLLYRGTYLLAALIFQTWLAFGVCLLAWLVVYEQWLISSW